MLMKVVEYLAELKKCPKCGHEIRAQFPQGVESRTQYEIRARAFGVYLMIEQLLPVDRASQMFAHLTGRIERGEVKKPHKATLQAIASRLGVRPDEIQEY